MCFGGSSKSTKPPPPTPSARFDYNVPQSGTNQQRAVAQANSPDTDPLKQSQLGSGEPAYNPGSL